MAKARHFVLHTVPGGVAWGGEHWQPRADMCHTRNAIFIEVEAPGVEEKSLDLRFEPGQLIVSGRRDRPQWPEAARCLQVEIEYGVFQRVLSLPPEADGAHIEARYEAGLLHIVVPLKAPEEPPNRRVDVR